MKENISPEIRLSVEIYEEVIQNLCEFYRNIGINESPIKIYETFRYMYLNSYLSSGKYSDNIPGLFRKLEFLGYVPIDVSGIVLLANYGICRHTTGFLAHVYSGLSYESSQLFVYEPHLNFLVNNHGTEFLTNYHAQKYIDAALQGFDLFSEEEAHFVKIYDDIEVKIDYFPSKDKPNHTINIVKNKNESRSYILDVLSHRIGDIIDEKNIVLHDLGLTYAVFVDLNPKFNTYYNTDYENGLWLLNTFDTQTAKDVLDSALFRDECPKFEREYKEFKLNNQRKFDVVADNLQQLIRRKF